MRAEDTLQFMTDFYPDLFYNRQRALNHLFCVNGNGYKWINGELVSHDRFYDKYMLKEPVEKADFSYAEYNHKYMEQIRRLTIKATKGKEGLDKYDVRLKEEKWYPICEFAKICNIPDDIKPDWLELVNECKALLAEDGIEIPVFEWDEETKRYVNKPMEDTNETEDN